MFYRLQNSVISRIYIKFRILPIISTFKTLLNLITEIFLISDIIQNHVQSKTCNLSPEECNDDI